MKTRRLKFAGVALFVVAFLLGGFFTNIAKVHAENAIQSFPYTLSKVYSYPNNVGGITTIVRIGCVPGSGDIYDINTGKLCSYSVPGARMGCAVQSGDTYDINTGKRCLYLTSNVSIGCSSISTDLYDINNGNRCINNSIIISKVANPETAGNSGKVTITTPPSTPSAVPSDTFTNTLPEQGTIPNNLGASAKGIKSIFTWPMSTRGIIIIILIILIIGYGVYSVITRNSSDNEFAYVEPKNKNKEVVKPIITSPQASKIPNQQSTPTSVEQPKAQVKQEAPLSTNPPTNTSNPQMPLNIPGNQNSQGK